jgi:hypothetical protein
MQPPSDAAAREGEHVYIVSDELEQVEAKTIDAELEYCMSKACLRLVIFNGTYLGFQLSNSRDVQKDYWLNLAFLDTRPVRQPDRFWLTVAALSGAATVGTFAVMHSPLAATLAVSLLVTTALTSVATVASLGLAAFRACNRIVFLSQHGRAAVLQLPVPRKDREHLERFVHELRAAASRAKARCVTMRGDYLRDEMKEHRRLLESGVLRVDQFEAARSLILGAHG